VFHHFLPETDQKDFAANLQAGYKGGTKLKFQDKSGAEVIFVLAEGKHPGYKRVGNNLHVTVSVSSRQARTGCQLNVESLSNDAIPVNVPAETKAGDEITVKGEGWPIRRTGRKGDLIVHVVIRSRRRRKHFSGRRAWRR
jgi:DnaJ-class molecular chaperone